MNKRLSIDSLRRLYFDADPDLSEEDPGSETSRCSACGAEVPEQDGELFPIACPACGHEAEACDPG